MLDLQRFAEQAQERQLPRVLFGPGVDPNISYAKWICIYPNYLDADKTRHQGRRISAAKGVSAPGVMDMAEAAHILGIRYVVEDKAYSRDFLVRGRLRLYIFGEEGHTAINPLFPSRKAVMEKVAAFLTEKRLELKSASADPQTQAVGSSSKQKKKKK